MDPFAELESLVLRAQRLREAGRVQLSSLNLVTERAEKIKESQSALRNALPGRGRELALTSYVAELVDLGANVAVMESKIGDCEAELLAKELVLSYLDAPTNVETFFGRSARAIPFPRVSFGQAPGELTMAFLTSSPSLDPPNRRGLVSHEVAHFEPSVRALLTSYRRGHPRRGEVLADLFGLSTLGPAFAWGLSESAIASPSAWAGSPSHPPLSVRSAVLEASLGPVWDSADLRGWIGNLLQGAAQVGGVVPLPWIEDCQSSLGDLRGSANTLRAKKVDEQAVLRVRGNSGSNIPPSAIERLTALCPR